VDKSLSTPAECLTDEDARAVAQKLEDRQALGSYSDWRLAVASALRELVSLRSASGRSVEKFKHWVETTPRPSMEPSAIAFDAQVRCLRQLLEYLGGDEYLERHVEWSWTNKTRSTAAESDARG
jgi:hypothetical protein